MLRKSYDFDPLQNRESLLSQDRLLIRYMNETSASPLKPMGEVARNRLQDALRCWLAGLDDAVAETLPRYCDWLGRAIDADEHNGGRHEFHRVSLRSAYALGRWMLRGDAAGADWKSAAAGELADWQGPARPFDPITIAEQRLEDYLAYCVQSRQYETGIREAECRVVRIRLHARAAPSPRDLAYATCRHHARGEFGADELFEAGRRMLQQQLPSAWLGRGHLLKAAMWLKIVYWDRDALRGRKPRLTPLQTVLRAYRNMPRGSVPDFVRLDGD